MSTEQIFTAIADVLLGLLAAEQETAELRSLQTVLETLQQQSTQLNEILATYTADQLTHEFLEQASDIIEYITDLRLVDPSYRKELNETGIYTVVNNLVSRLKKTIYLNPISFSC